MGDMKDKFKGFMKKVNNQISSSSSGKFKGEGRVLGSSTTDGPANPIHSRYYQNQTTNPTPKPKPASTSPSPSSSASPSSSSDPNRSIVDLDQKKPSSVNNYDQGSNQNTGFDPYGSLMTSAKRSQNGFTLNVFECPICGSPFKSEEEVSEHVESCLDSNSHSNSAEKNSDVGAGDKSEIEIHVGAFVTGKLPEGSLDVVLRLFRNIVKEPDNAKFRKIRMSNPKIREAIGEVAGGIELLEFVGFKLSEEGGEMWAMIEVPSSEKISLINEVITLLEPRKIEAQQKVEELPTAVIEETKEASVPKKVDRQIRIFFSVPESVAAKMELPDSFYNLSVDEIKREADMRKKKMAESQLLIPKSYKEKQAKAARRRYKKTVIRVQFPDGVVLQSVFNPWEPTSALYEVVSSALKEPSLQFELLDPVLVKRRVIPCFPAAGEKSRTLEDEDLVPSALIKFRPIETDSIVFTGLSNELLEIIEPLVNDSSAMPV